MRKNYFILIGFVLANFLTFNAYAQVDRNPISFQGILKQNNDLLIDQQVYFRLGLYSDTTLTALYEEVQDTLTNEFALFNIYLGSGNSTGNGQNDDFNDVIWSAPIWLKIEYRINELDNFEWLGTRKFQAMVFAMYADSASGEGVGINNLFDVENNLQTDYLLKWDGEKWVSSTDAIYAWNTISADSSIYSDTTIYAWNIVDTMHTDTVIYSFYSDSIKYSIVSDSTLFSTTSLWSDTANYAFDVVNAWKITGNSGDNLNLLGTLDSSDFIVKTNNIEAMNISAKGEVLLNGSANYHADLQTLGNVLMEGEHQPYSMDTVLENVFYWEPRKSSIVIGREMTPFFTDSLSTNRGGQFSFAGGRQSLANSWSFAWGDSCIASGNNVIVLGANNIASPLGGHKFGTGVVLGNNNEATLYRSTLIGSYLKVGNLGGSNTAIGSHSQILRGGGLINIGNHIINDGRSHFMIGNYLHSTGNVASPKTYSMMIGDHSTTSYLENTNIIRYQLLMRFDGGVYIYSDSLLTTGVVLYSGSGSWALMSDRGSKENFKKFNWIDQSSRKINNLHSYNWNYMAQEDETVHLGVMAQDFNNAFNLKEDPSRISMIDMDGITLSGIQSLTNKLDKDENKLMKIEKELKDIKLKRKQITELLEKIESKRRGETL